MDFFRHVRSEEPLPYEGTLKNVCEDDGIRESNVAAQKYEQPPDNVRCSINSVTPVVGSSFFVRVASSPLGPGEARRPPSKKHLSKKQRRAIVVATSVILILVVVLVPVLVTQKKTSAEGNAPIFHRAIPKPTPTPTSTPTPTPTASPTAKITASHTASSSLSPTGSSTPTPSATATKTSNSGDTGLRAFFEHNTRSLYSFEISSTVVQNGYSNVQTGSYLMNVTVVNASLSATVLYVELLSLGNQSFNRSAGDGVGGDGNAIPFLVQVDVLSNSVDGVTFSTLEQVSSQSVQVVKSFILTFLRVGWVEITAHLENKTQTSSSTVLKHESTLHQESSLHRSASLASISDTATSVTAMNFTAASCDCEGGRFACTECLRIGTLVEAHSQSNTVVERMDNVSSAILLPEPNVTINTDLLLLGKVTVPSGGLDRTRSLFPLLTSIYDFSYEIIQSFRSHQSPTRSEPRPFSSSASTAGNRSVATGAHRRARAQELEVKNTWDFDLAQFTLLGQSGSVYAELSLDATVPDESDTSSFHATVGLYMGCRIGSGFSCPDLLDVSVDYPF
eukprot:RCo021969